MCVSAVTAITDRQGSNRASVECFTYISATSDLVFPTQGYNHITLYTVGGEATAKEIKVSQLEI